MGRHIIRSIRKGSAQWNEEDRLQLVSILAKAGYAVRMDKRPVPGSNPENRNAKTEYVVEFWEEE